MTENYEQIVSYLDKTNKILVSFLEKALPELSVEWWEKNVVEKLNDEQRERVINKKITSLSGLDLAALLRILDNNWNELSPKYKLYYEDKHLLKEMYKIRNRWAHKPMDGYKKDVIYRDLDTIQLFITLVSPNEGLINEIDEAKKSIFELPKEDKQEIISESLTSKPVYWYTKSAEQGDSDAQFNLGLCYYNGEGVPKDKKMAVYWFSKSAEQGYSEAQYNLGVCYYNGEGIPKDMKKAVYWFSKSAEQGYSEAQYNLGVRYYNGEGVPKDMKKAVYWYTKSAEQGNSGAQVNLGTCYRCGEGVPKDMKKAVYWLTKSAEQGEPYAQFNLGVHYTKGEGVPKDIEKAVYWYIKSAEQGDARAQLILGTCYRDGEGVPKDMKKAVYWLTKSAEQGNDIAKEYLGKIKNEKE
jgi:TPR repeat protein